MPQTTAKEVNMVRCEAFGNRCTICGSYFDGDICSYQHEIGQMYPVPVRTEAKKPVVVKKRKTVVVKCGVVSGCKCSICMQFFADGDDICNSGHQIGQEYDVEVD